MTKENNNLSFYSSWGVVTTDNDGYVLEVNYDGDVENDPENYIKDIKRFDVFELRLYLSKLGFPNFSEYDILDAGFWTTDNWDYEKPSLEWREQIIENVKRESALTPM